MTTRVLLFSRNSGFLDIFFERFYFNIKDFFKIIYNGIWDRSKPSNYYEKQKSSDNCYGGRVTKACKNGMNNVDNTISFVDSIVNEVKMKNVLT